MEELPAEGLGTIKDPNWSCHARTVSRSNNYSQALGFPPGTKLTITNISKSIHHTFKRR